MFKAPKLKNRDQFTSWARRFTAFLELYKASWPLIMKPTSRFVMHIPDTQVDGIRQGFVPQALPNPVLPWAGYQLSQAERDEFDDQVDAYTFANSALAEAIDGFAEASAVVSAVQWPNVTAAWAALQRRFTPTTHLDRFVLAAEFESLGQKDNESVQDYGMRVMNLQIRMLRVNGAVDELSFVFRFVQGLRALSQSRRDTLSTTLTLREAIEQATNYAQSDRVRQANQRPPRSGGAGAYSADASDKNSKGDAKKKPAGAKGGKQAAKKAVDKSQLVCFNCGDKGHYSRECPKPKQKGASNSSDSNPRDVRGVCRWCRQPGHMAKDCPRRKSGKTQVPSARSADAEFDDEYVEEEPQARVVIADDRSEVECAPASFAASSSRGVPFLWDSGATHTMCDGNLPLQDEQSYPQLIRTAGAQRLGGAQIGSLAMTSSTGERVEFDQALQHPQLSHNLLSVSKLLELPGAHECIFRASGVQLVGKKGETLLQGRRHGSLYYTELFPTHPRGTMQPFRRPLQISEAAALAAADEAKQILLWHERLGHAGIKGMLALRSAFDASELADLPSMRAAADCDACREGKQVRLSFAKSVPEAHRAERPLQRVSADLQGPIEPETADGARYALVMVDNFSGFIWVIPIRTKADAAGEIQRWALRMRAQHGIRQPSSIPIAEGNSSAPS